MAAHKLLLLQILIPTYNRSKFLDLNLNKVVKQIRDEHLGDSVGILIRDNGSLDGTRTVVEDMMVRDRAINIQYNRNPKNNGPESNFVSVLSDATTDYIMFLGDDDFLPDGYLRRVIDIITTDENVAFIVPGFGELAADGSFQHHRKMPFDERVYPPGIEAIIALSSYAHQLSGLVFRRFGLLDAYLKHPQYRNLYPFIHFACSSMSMGRSYFIPKFTVTVWCGNTKDWRYDDSGLLTEVFKNYKASLCGLDVARAQLSFVLAQTWRTRFSLRKPGNYLSAVWHMWRHDSTHILVKIFLLVLPFKLVLERGKLDSTSPRSQMRNDLLKELGI